MAYRSPHTPAQEGSIGQASGGSSGKSLSQKVRDRVFDATSLRATSYTVEKWRSSFEKLLQHKEGLEVFTNFLKSEYSHENIEFWLACENYKKLSPAKRVTEASNIYRNYIREDAPRMINVDAATRAMTRALLDRADKNTFDGAQKRIYALMERDSYSRFFQSEVFMNWLEQNKIAV